jgi:hypothetical protein
MEEQRRYKRHSVPNMNCTILSATEVKILNMSIGGAALMADGRLNIGREYTLKIEDRGKSYGLRGTIIWSVLSGSKKNSKGEIVPVYKAGLKFVDIHTERLTELLSFIEQHKKSPEQRIIVRFDVTSPEKATLNCPISYRVKKISLGGILLEADQPLVPEDVFPMEILLGEQGKIEFLGRVASCCGTAGAETESYDIGIEFLEMSAESRKILTLLTESM